jgi:hypothetical protein
MGHQQHINKKLHVKRRKNYNLTKINVDIWPLNVKISDLFSKMMSNQNADQLKQRLLVNISF